MAKRIFTPKTVSPEMARENALSAARATVHNCRNHVKLSQISPKFLAAAASDPSFEAAARVTVAQLQAALANAESELVRAEAALVALEGI